MTVRSVIPDRESLTLTVIAAIEDAGGPTRMVLTTTFPSGEAMDQMTQMGMVEGIREALGQTDALLARVDR